MSSVRDEIGGSTPGKIEGVDVAMFREHGYVVVPGLFVGDELAALQDECSAQIESGPGRSPADHFKRAVNADGTEVPFRIEAVLGKAVKNESTLLSMARPRVLQLVSALLGGEFVCWADALLWKAAEGGAAVPMHSGHGWSDTTVAHENLVVDVYLDRATPANGCLKVVPGSHRLPPDENRALLEFGYDVPGLVDVCMEPGDVLFHSEWMVHGSLATPASGSTARRILYLAFRSPEALVALDGSSAQRRVIAAAMRRMELAHRLRQRAPYAAAEEPFPLAIPPQWVDEVAAVTDTDARRVGYHGDIFGFASDEP